MLFLQEGKPPPPMPTQGFMPPPPTSSAGHNGGSYSGGGHHHRGGYEAKLASPHHPHHQISPSDSRHHHPSLSTTSAGHHIKSSPMSDNGGASPSDRLSHSKNPSLVQKVRANSPFSQVSAWQSATLLPISCNSVQPVPAQVEELVSPVKQSSSDGTTNNPPFPKMP